MMKEIRFTTQAKRDLKKYRHDLDKMRELYKVLHVLASGEQLDKLYRPHPLKGNYKGCMECHVGSDFLLIWVDRDVIELVRVGSHSELFNC